MLDREVGVRLIDAYSGIIPLQPAFVARDWITEGRRLGLTDEAYDAGERGAICERWLSSTTQATNLIMVEGEGISTVNFEDQTIRLDHLFDVCADVIVGQEYAEKQIGLGCLAKVFDYGERVPLHVHPPTEVAQRLGTQSKDEAYYFLPGADLGRHPESFFGMHAGLSADEAREELLDHLRRWEGPSTLALSLGYQLFSEGGYFVPSGVIHGAGTALTLELQEISDAMCFLQAASGSVQLSKEHLLNGLDPDEVAKRGEEAITDWIDWDANLTSDFHTSNHISPRIISAGNGVEIAWILYGSTKFAAKRYRLEPGARVQLDQVGGYSVFFWQGTGTLNGVEFVSGELGRDEALLTHNATTAGVTLENPGSEQLEMVAFFGTGLQPEAPIL